MCAAEYHYKNKPAFRLQAILFNGRINNLFLKLSGDCSMDLRITKTKKAIVNAFLSLRAKRPLEKITVKELCEIAMINKSTFYSHYADIYELSDFLENEVVLSVIQSMDHSEYIWENAGEFARQLFLGYLSQDRLIQILFSDSRSSLFVSKIEQSVKEMVAEKYPQYCLDPVQNMVLTYTIYGGYYAYIKSRNYDQEQILSVLVSLTQNAGEWLTSLRSASSPKPWEA